MSVPFDVSERLCVFYLLSVLNKWCFVQQEVTINYNKLHADPKQGKTLDIGEFPFI